jgi:hypothetical protein
MESDEGWYVLRDGKYFCRACGDELTKRTVSPAFALGAGPVGVEYTCQHGGCKNFDRGFILSDSEEDADL